MIKCFIMMAISTFLVPEDYLNRESKDYLSKSQITPGNTFKMPKQYKQILVMIVDKKFSILNLEMDGLDLQLNMKGKIVEVLKRENKSPLFFLIEAHF